MDCNNRKREVLEKVAFVKSIAMEPVLHDINENWLGFSSLYCKTSGLAN
jgi:hypothetical protein